MVKVKIMARWGETNLETGEPIEALYCDLEFSDEDMTKDQSEALKLSWNAIRGQYLLRTRGKHWYLKEKHG